MMLALRHAGKSVAIYHTAGKGTRLAPLPGAENNNKPGAAFCWRNRAGVKYSWHQRQNLAALNVSGTGLHKEDPHIWKKW